MVACACALTAPARAQGPVTPGQPGTITVSSDASVQATPDLVEIDLGVVSEAKTAAAAGDENAKKMDRLMAALKKEVGAGGEVKTIGYLLTHQYEEQPKPPRTRPAIVAYTVTNLVRVRSPEVKGAGRLIDLALQMGANEVQRLVFTLKNPEPVRAEALKAAAGKARAHATTLATALGAKLGDVLSVNETEGGGIPFREVSTRMGFAAAGTPIEGGTLEIRASVSVIFGLSR